MSSRPVFLAVTVGTVLVVGCSERGSSPAPEKPSTPRPVAVESAPDGWLGKWNGPEGTFLQLEGGNGKYEVTIENLDGPRRFQGAAVGAGIEFERDGTKEVVRATNGAETGMKWLAGKSNCLTVRVGEGYCRP
jgi:hypothetical protein